jgi:hypothetical protein
LSYDLNFWKQDRPLSLSPVEIYRHLSEEEHVDGLAKLPVKEILARLKARFPQFNPKDPSIEFDEGSIEVSWSDRDFRFDLRGDIPAADQNALVEIMRGFDCPLYDPQIDKRYDRDNGTAIGDPPVFEDLTEDQKEELEKAKAKAIAAFAGLSQRKGCGRAVLLLGTASVAIAAIIRRSLQ